jgi:N,N'-diacetyllegionaminate synthase
MTKFIAELCQNHLGKRENLFKMVDEACLSGADYIKIQHIYTRNLVFRPRFEKGMKLKNEVVTIKRPFNEEYDRLSKLELSNDCIVDFVNYVKSKGKTPITTCFATDDIDLIRKQGFSVVKVASYDSTSYAMIDNLLKYFDKVLISLGANFESETRYLFDRYGDNPKVDFLHAVTIYPTPIHQSKLRNFTYYQNLVGRVGFSDHSDVYTEPLTASMIAIHLGATYIERHFTVLDNSLIKDGPVSINPKQLSELVEFSKMNKTNQKSLLDNLNPKWIELIKGEVDFDLTHQELLNRDYYKGRFASPRTLDTNDYKMMKYNWEEA